MMKAQVTGICPARLAYGLAGLAVFAPPGVAAAATGPSGGPAGAVPTLVGVAAGALVLLLLVRAAAAPAAWAPTFRNETDRHPGPAPVASPAADGRRRRGALIVPPAAAAPSPLRSPPVMVVPAGSVSGPGG